VQTSFVGQGFFPAAGFPAGVFGNQIKNLGTLRAHFRKSFNLFTTAGVSPDFFTPSQQALSNTSQ